MLWGKTKTAKVPALDFRSLSSATESSIITQFTDTQLSYQEDYGRTIWIIKIYIQRRNRVWYKLTKIKETRLNFSQMTEVYHVFKSYMWLIVSRHLHQREQKDIHRPFTKNKQKYTRDYRLKWITKSQLTKLLLRLRDVHKRGDGLSQGNGLEGLWMDCIFIWDPSKYFPPLGRTVTYTGLVPVLLTKHGEKVSNLSIRPLGFSACQVPSNLLVSNQCI